MGSLRPVDTSDVKTKSPQGPPTRAPKGFRRPYETLPSNFPWFRKPRPVQPTCSGPQFPGGLGRLVLVVLGRLVSCFSASGVSFHPLRPWWMMWIKCIINPALAGQGLSALYCIYIPDK